MYGKRAWTIKMGITESLCVRNKMDAEDLEDVDEKEWGGQDIELKAAVPAHGKADGENMSNSTVIIFSPE